MRGAERVLGGVVLLTAVAVAAMASRYTVRFMVDPLGPQALPYLVAGLLGLSGAVLLLRRPAAAGDAPPSSDPAHPTDAVGAKRQFAGIATLAAYAVAIPWLGFLAATTLATAGLARLFGGSWPRGLLTGLAFALALYALFALGFGLDLPAGRLLESVR